MSKKGKKRKKNPVLEQKFNEGYVEGFKQGEEFGIQKSIAFFQSKFAGLEDVKGIGPVTMKKIKEHLGPKYFK